LTPRPDQQFTEVVTSRVRHDRAAVPFVSLTTDLGRVDNSVGILHAVIHAIAPGVTIVDLLHDVPPFEVAPGARALWAASPYLPVGVHMVSVNPEADESSTVLALRVARGDVLVGANNGCLIDAAERLGGITGAWSITNGDYLLTEGPSTFHARDIYAPATAHLALGVDPALLGPAVDTATLTRLPVVEPVVEDGALHTQVVAADIFGNVEVAGTPDHLHAALGPVALGDRLQYGHDRELTFVTTYGDAQPGDPVAFWNGDGVLTIVVVEGDARATLGLPVGTPVTLRRA
jgi:hypothetical protein